MVENSDILYSKRLFRNFLEYNCTGVQCTGVPRCAISVRSPAFYADGGCVCVQIFRNTETRLSLLILCFFTSELVASTDSEPDL